MIAEKIPTMMPRISARLSAMMSTCSVWPAVRVMSGQIGWSVCSETPSLCVKMFSTQNQ